VTGARAGPPEPAPRAPAPPEAEPPVARLRRLAGRAVDALHVLEAEHVQQRAMALTYISLFALVPALVVAFSVVQAFTGVEAIAGRVREFLLDHLAVGARATLEPYLARFLQNAHATSAGLVGAALLVWSSISLFSNVDRAVNKIWGIHRARPLRQRALIYWVSLTLGPLLLAGSVMLDGAARALLDSWGARALTYLASGGLTCTFFALVYLLVPATKVELRAAVAGGLVAGAAWEVAKFGYTFAVARFFRLHAIYGSVAAVPIFLLWLYVSWAILLFGARLAFLVQFARALGRGAALDGSRTGREVVAGKVMLEVARAFQRGEPAPDIAEIAARAGLVAEDAAAGLEKLAGARLVVTLADKGAVPARALERITLRHVREAVFGEEALPDDPSPVAALVFGAEDAAARRLDEVTFRDLCDRASAPAPGALAEASGGAAARAG
jgi:membrane protein